MKYLQQIVTASFCIFLGFLFFLYQESWIIFTSPFAQQEEINPILQQNISYKSVTLYCWHNNTYKKETTHIIYSENTGENIKHLINQWLIFLDDEHITNKETQIISVALSPSKQEAFICLNQPPFDKSWNTYQKLMWIESILKTIRENKIPITHARFLVHHQPLQDDHLNFEISWPISGFAHQQ